MIKKIISFVIGLCGSCIIGYAVGQKSLVLGLTGFVITVVAMSLLLRDQKVGSNE